MRATSYPPRSRGCREQALSEVQKLEGQKVCRTWPAGLHVLKVNQELRFRVATSATRPFCRLKPQVHCETLQESWKPAVDAWPPDRMLHKTFTAPSLDCWVILVLQEENFQSRWCHKACGLAAVAYSRAHVAAKMRQRLVPRSQTLRGSFWLCGSWAFS